MLVCNLDRPSPISPSLRFLLITALRAVTFSPPRAILARMGLNGPNGQPGRQPKKLARNLHFLVFNLPVSIFWPLIFLPARLLPFRLRLCLVRSRLREAAFEFLPYFYFLLSTFSFSKCHPSALCAIFNFCKLLPASPFQKTALGPPPVFGAKQCHFQR
jgi:hypothetical protein